MIKKTDKGAGQHSTMAIKPELAQRIRDLAKANSVSVFDVTNGLLKFALEHSKPTIEVRQLTLAPVDEVKKPRR